MGVDEDSAAVFADDDFLAHFDFELFLRRDAVEAAAAGVALYVDDTEAVAGVFADAFESGEGAGVDLGFEGEGFFSEAFFVLAGFGNDFVEFGAFFAEDVFAVAKAFLGGGDVAVALLDGAVILVDMLFGEFDFEGLEFDFFREKVKFAVVSDVVQLLFVASDFVLRVVVFLFFGGEFLLEVGDLVVVVDDAGAQAFDVVFEVFDFEW